MTNIYFKQQFKNKDIYINYVKEFDKMSQKNSYLYSTGYVIVD